MQSDPLAGLIVFVRAHPRRVSVKRCASTERYDRYSGCVCCIFVSSAAQASARTIYKRKPKTLKNQPTFYFFCSNNHY